MDPLVDTLRYKFTKIPKRDDTSFSKVFGVPLQKNARHIPIVIRKVIEHFDVVGNLIHYFTRFFDPDKLTNKKEWNMKVCLEYQVLNLW